MNWSSITIGVSKFNRSGREEEEVLKAIIIWAEIF